ncbi:homing endonuclease associated repeat-containing protein [Halorubrum sp. BOL3-1]|uniref:homing endonuclease associated repeat-containing protein n=1 Tax=Halorubrum sp. BOL3-1 TaxID=2497325 RepID=UPI00374363C3
MRRFGSRADALAAAALDAPDQNKTTDAERIADPRRSRDEFGERPTSTDVAREGEYGLATYQRRFGSRGEAEE